MLIPIFAALCQPAVAASNFLALETGGQRTDDPAWNELSDSDSWRTLGVSGGYALLPYLDVTASFHRKALGSEHGFESGAPGADMGFVAAWSGNQYGLGVALEPDLTHWLRPYLGARGTLTQSTLRVDDDTDSEENPNQLLDRALAPGFTAAAGARLALGLPDWTIVPALHLEMGYGWTTEMDYGELGDLNLRGFAIRGGVGVMF